MSHFLIAQIIGSIAVVISLAVYQLNNRRRMLQLSAISATLYAVSFYFLQAYTGSALNLIAAARCYTFTTAKTKQNSTKIFTVFAVMSLTATYFTWAGPISILALLGTLFSGMAAGQLSTKNIRRVALLAPPLWFTYNLLTHSYPGMLIEVFIICSNLVGQYRFDRKDVHYKLKSESNI